MGWLEDGSFLYTVPGRSTSTSFTASTSPAAKAVVFSNENINPLSPDGQYVAIARLAFGERWQIDISRLDGADRWALANDSLGSEPLWSASGEWLLATVSATDSGSTTGALINLRTCQVISLRTSKQPPRLEAVRFPSPGGWGSGGRFAPTAISTLVGSVI